MNCRRGTAAAAIIVAVAASASAFAQEAVRTGCRGVVYLTLDTGNMRHAELIAETLHRYDVKATFFLANERTPRGDHALDASWTDYWKARAAEGHAFGTHTWRHGRFLGDVAGGAVRYRPQFGEDAGHELTLTPAQVCEELRRVGSTFEAMTGQVLDPVSVSYTHLTLPTN